MMSGQSITCLLEPAIRKCSHTNARLGFVLEPSRSVDLVCTHPSTGERWQIAAKGITTAIGLDFRTGLGQLLQRMSDRNAKHAISVPKIPQYEAQIFQMTPWVVDHLGIHWLLISPDGSVAIIPPKKA